MSGHRVAVLNCNNVKREDLESNLLSKLSNAVVYSTSSQNGSILLPEEVRSSVPKMLNWTIAQERVKPGRGKWLHIVMDTVKINSSPELFMDSLEKMMSHLKLESWLNTTCDPMNYVYKKYAPRLETSFDAEDAEKAGTPALIFASHANVCWTCYDLDAPKEAAQYNEDFTFPMYYIVDFLARRKARSAGKTLDFMNMYPTVPSEHGVFENVLPTAFQFSQDTIKAEDEKFKALGLAWQPDNSVDIVLERVYNIIKGNK